MKIQKIRARCLLPPPPLISPSRYGKEEEGWSQWRKVNRNKHLCPRIHQVELTSSTKLSSYGDDYNGWLDSLVVTNLDNGTQQVFGNHEKIYDFWSLRESPPLDQSGLAFTHLYGVEDHPSNFSVCFNIEWGDQLIWLENLFDFGKLIENWFWKIHAWFINYHSAVTQFICHHHSFTAIVICTIINFIITIHKF